MLTSSDVGDWNAYAEREPFGLDDQQFGLLRALVASAAGAKNIDVSAFSIAGMIRLAREYAAGSDADPGSIEAFDRIVHRGE